MKLCMVDPLFCIMMDFMNLRTQAKYKVINTTTLDNDFVRRALVQHMLMNVTLTVETTGTIPQQRLYPALH